MPASSMKSGTEPGPFRNSASAIFMCMAIR